MTDAKSNSRAVVEGFFQRLKSLEEDRRTTCEDIKELKSEIKSQGFDGAAIAAAVKLTLLDADKREKLEAKEAALHEILSLLGLLPPS